MDAVHNISLFGLLLAYSMILVLIGLSHLTRLKLEKDLFIGSLRAMGQLYIMGAVLVYIFSLHRWYVVMGLLILMMLFATHTAIRRIKRPIPGLFTITLSALIAGSVITLVFITGVVVGWKPWYEPRYLIPIGGMVLGNSMNGLALAADRLVSELAGNRHRIETLLALGASPSQAAKQSILRSARAAMIPSINNMMVMGMVLLPGMMSGQIIAGASPVTAVRYQVVIVYAIIFSAALSTLFLLYRLYRKFFTAAYQLRHDLLVEQ